MNKRKEQEGRFKEDFKNAKEGKWIPKKKKLKSRKKK